jgi:hypothetical protein
METSMHDHDGDDELLGMLTQLGVDFKKPREINFYFVFPTEPNADQAKTLLSQKRFNSEKIKLDVPWWKRLFAKPQWMLSVTHTMPLDESQIKNTTTLFTQIANASNGDYDGWEANVMDDQIDADRLQGLQ